MGVGAAIAAGSQGENGKRALFVIKVNRRKEITKELGSLVNTDRSEALQEKRTIEAKKKESPIRFISKVKKPEVKQD